MKAGLFASWTVAAVLQVSGSQVFKQDGFVLDADESAAPLTTDTYRDQSGAVCVSQSNDDYFAVWQSNHGGISQVYGQKLAVSDSSYIAGMQRMSEAGLMSSEPSAVRLKSAESMAVLFIEVGTKVVLRLFDLDGNPQTPMLDIDSGPAIKFAPSLALLSDDDGSYERGLVVWTQGDSGLNPQSFARMVDLQSLEVGDLMEIRESQARDPRATALSSGLFLLTYTADSDRSVPNEWNVFGRLMSDTGEPQSSEFMINSETCGDQALPKAAALANGYFVVVWADAQRQGLYARVFDQFAHKCGDEMLVASDAVAAQVFVAFAEDLSVVFGVAYASVSDATDSSSDDDMQSEVFAQLYEFTVSGDTCDELENASTVGPAFQVNSAEQGCQKPTDAVALTSDGRFAISMMGDDFDVNGLGIAAQLYQLSKDDGSTDSQAKADEQSSLF